MLLCEKIVTKRYLCIAISYWPLAVS